MAVIKAVSSKAGINTVLDYVMQEEKTEQKLLSGLNCVPDTVKDEMRVTKLLWDKDGGRTYKHFVQSFAPGEKIDPAQAHQIACQLAASRPEWQDFEVLIATHEDKEHIHTHFVVNSVSYVDGHKLQQSKAELQAMKDYSDQLCAKYGLHITEKGKTFDGQEREETAAFSKDTYQLLKKAEQGEVKSYVQDIALAILDCREQATSRTDFVQRMNERGYGVDWQDSHKYITFTDLKRQEQGEKQCKIRNNKLEKYYNMQPIEEQRQTIEQQKQTISELSSQISLLKSEMQKLADKNAQLNETDEVQEIQKENAELKKQNEQLKQVCADTREMISNFKKETERLQKQKKLLIGVVNTLMEKCMGVTEETQDIQTKKSFFGRVKGLTWERWQRIINAVTALGATVQACNRTLKAQPKAVVERKKSIRVQLQEIKEKHGTRD